MSESSDLTYYQKNRYVMLNRAKEGLYDGFHENY